jgi:hypothetical protein
MLLRDGEPCPLHGKGVDLASQSGRKDLRRDVALLLSSRRGRRPAVIAATATSLLVVALLVRMGLLFATMWVGALFLVVAGVVLVRRRRAPVAIGPTSWTGESGGEAGVVSPAGDTLRAPGTGRPCVAYGLRLSVRGVPLLGDARSAGFDVKLADGRLVRIPAGSLTIACSRGRLRRLHGKQASEYTAGIDPLDGVPSLDVFPYDDAAEITLHPGDRVLVRGPFEKEPGEDGSYREPPADVWRPKASPAVRLV